MSVKHLDWTAYYIEQIGQISDVELAKQMNIPVHRVRGERVRLGIDAHTYWTPANIALLGQMADRALAQHLNCSLGAVKAKRKQLNISPFGTPKACAVGCR